MQINSYRNAVAADSCQCHNILLSAHFSDIRCTSNLAIHHFCMPIIARSSAINCKFCLAERERERERERELGRSSFHCQSIFLYHRMFIGRSCSVLFAAFYAASFCNEFLLVWSSTLEGRTTTTTTTTTQQPGIERVQACTR